MNSETLTYVVTGFLCLLTVLYVIGVVRGRRMQRTNEKIEKNQRNLIALQERQVSALERIATQLEKRQ